MHTNPRPFGLAQGRLFEPREDGAASVSMASARTGKRGPAPQPSQRRGAPFQERIAINIAISPNMSPKPCTGYRLSFRNNGDIPSDVATQTKSTNHPSQVCASLWPKGHCLAVYQYRGVFIATSVRAPRRQEQDDQRNGALAWAQGTSPSNRRLPTASAATV
jgi:hypothetical protein